MDVIFCGAVCPIQQSASCFICIEIAPVGTTVTYDLGHLFSLKEAEFYVLIRRVRERIVLVFRLVL